MAKKPTIKVTTEKNTSRPDNMWVNGLKKRMAKNSLARERPPNMKLIYKGVLDTSFSQRN